MNTLRISMLQTTLIWEDPTANRAVLEEKISGLEHTADLIILPEMFTTGFTMNTGKAEVKGTHTQKWMKQMAEVSGSAVTGSYMAKENDGVYNHLLWVEPGGREFSYRKKHLFRMAGEHKYFQAGSERIQIHYKDWKICPLICYDLRFPEWSRNSFNKENGDAGYDLLLYVANWPAVRVSAWEALLKARAIENLAYCAGVNRVGTDGNGVEYNGCSSAFDYKGNELIHSKKEETLHFSIKKDELLNYREKFPAYLDADL